MGLSVVFLNRKERAELSRGIFVRKSDMLISVGRQSGKQYCLNVS